jgi:hypothetical protein
MTAFPTYWSSVGCPTNNTLPPSFVEQFAPTLPKAVNYVTVASVGVLITVVGIVTAIYVITLHNILVVVAL